LLLAGRCRRPSQVSTEAGWRQYTNRITKETGLTVFFLPARPGMSGRRHNAALGVAFPANCNSDAALRKKKTVMFAFLSELF
jgi:hypothetical protein